MHLHSFRVRNFRRLKDVYIDLESGISIFVGSNNSGKTSATQAIPLFMSGERGAFSIHDFSSECWGVFDHIGAQEPTADEQHAFPKLSIDLWFAVGKPDLHRVLPLLPNLEWRGSLVGIRVEYAPNDASELVSNYRSAIAEVVGHARPAKDGQHAYKPWPSSLRDYLTKTLKDEYRFRYYVLDEAKFDKNFNAAEGYEPQELISDNLSGSGKAVLATLLKVDFLSAQRHIGETSAGDRAEDLSKCLSRFYSRNLQQRENDHDALRALAASEEELSRHLTKVFATTLTKLSTLGYPGVNNPQLLIKSALRIERLMSEQHAKVNYIVAPSAEGMEEFTLPDSYNGLGFKNLIYMVVELLDLHAAWLGPPDKDDSVERPPLHLVFVEEPEVHMHAQLQQAFIRKVLELLATDVPGYHSQLVMTTHSPHILYERGFRPLRYFRRSSGDSQWPTSQVFNLSKFYAENADDRDFLERYMKLTHCDLFFADAAVLVEGSVERLLLPLMIEKAAPRLQSSYLSILEVGGAFAHRFRKLIEFLGLTTLIITDIDSVYPAATSKPIDTDVTDGAELDVIDDEPGDATGKPRSACAVITPGAVTSNETLISWLPAKTTIAELLSSTREQKEQHQVDGRGAKVYITYQGVCTIAWWKQVRDTQSMATANQEACSVSWVKQEMTLAGRTLEEAFALENLRWSQAKERRSLKLHIKGCTTMDLSALATSIYTRVKSQYFSKTDFALGVLADKVDAWKVPTYIAEGLTWLESTIAPEQATISIDLPAEITDVSSAPEVTP